MLNIGIWTCLAAGAVAACIGLTGCEHAPPAGPKTIYLPGELRSCVPPELGEAPAYPDTDAALKAAPGAAERYQMVTAGRALRIGRAAEVEPIVKGCR